MNGMYSSLKAVDGSCPSIDVIYGDSRCRTDTVSITACSRREKVAYTCGRALRSAGMARSGGYIGDQSLDFQHFGQLPYGKFR